MWKMTLNIQSDLFSHVFKLQLRMHPSFLSSKDRDKIHQMKQTFNQVNNGFVHFMQYNCYDNGAQLERLALLTLYCTFLMLSS